MVNAHNLEIEYRRYKSIPREQRKFKWCDLTVNTSHIRNEHDAIFLCTLCTLNIMGKIDSNLEICEKNSLEHVFRAISTFF